MLSVLLGQHLTGQLVLFYTKYVNNANDNVKDKKSSIPLWKLAFGITTRINYKQWSNQRRLCSMHNIRKEANYRTCRVLMKFHFAVTGTAQADSEIVLVEWLQDIFAEYNSRSGSPLDSYHVLVRKDTVTDNILWTGESVYCICGHHVEYHFTKTLLASVFWSSSPFDRIFGCSFSKECKCQEFIPYSSKKELQKKN